MSKFYGKVFTFNNEPIPQTFNKIGASQSGDIEFTHYVTVEEYEHLTSENNLKPGAEYVVGNLLVKVDDLGVPHPVSGAGGYLDLSDIKREVDDINSRMLVPDGTTIVKDENNIISSVVSGTDLSPVENRLDDVSDTLEELQAKLESVISFDATEPDPTKTLLWMPLVK